MCFGSCCDCAGAAELRTNSWHKYRKGVWVRYIDPVRGFSMTYYLA